jgi:hypothetical protein
MRSRRPRGGARRAVGAAPALLQEVAAAEFYARCACFAWLLLYVLSAAGVVPPASREPARCCGWVLWVPGRVYIRADRTRTAHCMSCNATADPARRAVCSVCSACARLASLAGAGASSCWKVSLGTKIDGLPRRRPALDYLSAQGVTRGCKSPPQAVQNTGRVAGSHLGSFCGRLRVTRRKSSGL